MSLCPTVVASFEYGNTPVYSGNNAPQLSRIVTSATLLEPATVGSVHGQSLQCVPRRDVKKMGKCVATVTFCAKTQFGIRVCMK